MKHMTLAGAVGLISLLASAALAHDTNTTQQGTGGAMMGQAMMAPGLMMPQMDPQAGEKLFATKGCVICHSINGVGGTDAPALDAATMPGPMNPFDFAAKMWKGAPAMVMMQQQELGAQIEFTGDELASIIAFVHNPAAQAQFTWDDVPAKFRKKLGH